MRRLKWIAGIGGSHIENGRLLSAKSNVRHAASTAPHELHSTTTVPGVARLSENSAALPVRIACRPFGRGGRPRGGTARAHAIQRSRRSTHAVSCASHGADARYACAGRAGACSRIDASRPGASAKRRPSGIGGSSTARPKRVRTSSSTSRAAVRAVEHGRDHAAHLQLRIGELAHVGDRLEQLRDAAMAERLALERNEHLVGRGQAVDREHAERRRAVDQHGVERVAHGSSAAPTACSRPVVRQQVRPRSRRGRCWRGAVARPASRREPCSAPFHRARRAGSGARSGSSPSANVTGLRVEVDEQHPLAEVGEARPRVWVVVVLATPPSGWRSRRPTPRRPSCPRSSTPGLTALPEWRRSPYDRSGSPRDEERRCPGARAR